MSSASIWFKKERKEAEKRQFESRKRQVTSIKNSIYNVSEGYVSNINSNIDKLNASLSSGIKGLNIVASLRSSSLEEKEKAGTSDSYLSSYEGELASEISDCQKKIDSLESEIATLIRQYNNEVEREREAARRLLEKLKEKIV